MTLRRWRLRRRRCWGCNRSRFNLREREPGYAVWYCPGCWIHYLQMKWVWQVAESLMGIRNDCG